MKSDTFPVNKFFFFKKKKKKKKKKNRLEKHSVTSYIVQLYKTAKLNEQKNARGQNRTIHALLTQVSVVKNIPPDHNRKEQPGNAT